MSQYWRNILLSLSAVTLVFTACTKKSSSSNNDNPLPTNYNPSIIISSDNSIVYAIDPVTGKRNWEFDFLHSAVKGSPIVYNGMVYVVCAGGNPISLTTSGDTLYKLNAKTGKLVMKMEGDPTLADNIACNLSITSTPIADNGLIFLACNDVLGTTSNYIYAIDTGTGKTKWKYTNPADLSPILSSPVIYNGKIYFATTGGSIYCLNESLGGTLAATPFTVTPEIWTLAITGASFVSSPAVAPPYLFIGSTLDSNMYCIYLDPPPGAPATTGLVRWKYKSRGAINSSPAAYGGRCIFGCNDFRVYCLDTSINPPTRIKPDSIWISNTGGRIYSSPYVYNNVVYIGSDDAFLYALNMINGGLKWKFQTNAAITSSPLVYNGVVYIGSSDKNLYAIDTAGAQSTAKWYFTVNGIIECSPAIDNLSGAQINSQVSGYTNWGYPY